VVSGARIPVLVLPIVDAGFCRGDDGERGR
jgi:hypothetical protein